MEGRDFVSRRNLINDGSPPLPSVGRRAVNSRIREWINTFDDKRSGVEGVEGRNIVTRFLGFRPRKRLAAESLAGWWCGGEDGKVP